VGRLKHGHITSNSDDLLKLLNEKAKSLSLPKNRLWRTAPSILEHLEKAEYIVPIAGLKDR